MLKKILSFFIGGFKLILVAILSVLLLVRLFLSGSSMTSLIEIMMEDEAGIVESILDEGIDSEFTKYINEDEINKAIGEFVSDYLKYSGGAPGAQKPNSEGFRDLFEEYIDEYEKDTGVEIDEAEIEEIFNELDEELEEITNEPVDEDIALVFKIVYSDGLLIGIALVIIGCILVDYLIRRDWFIIMRHCGIVVTINFVGMLVVAMLLNMAIDASLDSVDKALFDYIINTCKQIGIIGLVIGIVLIVLSIVLKKNIAKSNQLESTNN